MVYLHAFRILVAAKNDLLMQKLYLMRSGVDVLKWAGILALMKPGLKALMRLVVDLEALLNKA